MWANKNVTNCDDAAVFMQIIHEITYTSKNSKIIYSGASASEDFRLTGAI